jgi:hypothetical protein
MRTEVFGFIKTSFGDSTGNAGCTAPSNQAQICVESGSASLYSRQPVDVCRCQRPRLVLDWGSVDSDSRCGRQLVGGAEINPALAPRTEDSIVKQDKLA